MKRTSIAIMLITSCVICSWSMSQTVISMPAPASPPSGESSVMIMVARAMDAAARAESGAEALYRYSHAKQTPYNVYHVQPRGSGLDWDFDVNHSYFSPRLFWGSYWGWGWPGCVTWSVGSPPANSPCGSFVFAVF